MSRTRYASGQSASAAVGRFPNSALYAQVKRALGGPVRKPLATRQDRSANAEANPASFRDLLHFVYLDIELWLFTYLFSGR